MLKIKEISTEIVDMVEKKNKDYGNSFDTTMDEYGIMSYFLRLEDKVGRLKNLTIDTDKPLINESIEDTLKDIIGYTLLMLNYMKQ